ncbi:hypothetical protein [Kallotenue papyrolyticum]|uniref:hypothetical protein n=1 Tax=Kallotenue papyrolyticum TaxID=1325125 RepID=UPI000492BC68|nr:hypothetical protein [Kallotenue papyrolyticum]
MAVTSRELHRQPVRRPAAAPRARPRLAARRDHLYTLTLVALLATALHLLAGQGRIWLDDLRYGRPRTTHLSARLGLNEQSGQPTHIIGMNLNRRVVVIVVPGGDSSRAQILQGPYLFGANEDLTPVELRTADVNRDSRADLIIGVKNENLIYINTGAELRLINDAERAQLREAQP